VAKSALAARVVLAPGNAFSVTETARSMMRFNVAQCQDERVFKILKDALQ
jgi:DNA-binding transcriptional MocR family regulator